jgi:hypothetical protein
MGGHAHELHPQDPEVTTNDLDRKIKAEIKKRSEAKAERMLLKRPRRLTKRCG